MQLTFADRVRATIIGGGASLVLAAATLAAPALAADQPTTTDTIGAHTHQIHGTVKTAVSAGGTSFTLTTRRYGDVAVTFIAPTTGHSHSRGKARSYELTSHDALTAGERLVVQGRTSADGKTFVARRVHVLPAANGDSNGNTNGGTNTNSNTSTSTSTNTNAKGETNDNGHANANANGNSNDQSNGDAHGTTHLVGTVVSANATSLSVKLADGTTPSVAITADTTIRPQGKTLADLTVGTKVTVVSKNGTATGIVVSPA